MLLHAGTVSPALAPPRFDALDNAALIAEGMRGFEGLSSLTDPAEQARIEREEIRAELAEAGLL